MPVTASTTRGTRLQRTIVTPAAASAPRCTGPSLTPAGDDGVAGGEVAAALAHVRARRAPPPARRRARPAPRRPRSARPNRPRPERRRPVAIAIASPALERPLRRPAGRDPRDDRQRRRRSAARSAKPSIADAGNDGRSTAADAGSASTRPAASVERHVLRVERLHPREDELERLVDAEQVVTGRARYRIAAVCRRTGGRVVGRRHLRRAVVTVVVVVVVVVVVAVAYVWTAR